MSIFSVFRLFVFDEIRCKEFNSVADVIFGASNSTVPVVSCSVE